MPNSPNPLNFHIAFVADSDLPTGKDWLIVRCGPTMICAVRESRVCPRVLESAWAGYRALTAA